MIGVSLPGRGSRPSDDGGSYTVQTEDLDASDATFTSPDLTAFCRPDELGHVVVGQRLEPDCALLACRVVDRDQWCHRCDTCHHVWRQDTGKAADLRAKLSRRGLRWALGAIVCQHLSVARVAEALAVSWDTAKTAVLDEGRRVLIDGPRRFDGVSVGGSTSTSGGIPAEATRSSPSSSTSPLSVQVPARLLDMVQGALEEDVHAVAGRSGHRLARDC